MTVARDAVDAGVPNPVVESPLETSGPRPVLSIVTPAFCEVENLSRLHEEIALALAGEKMAWELIIVDDGSVDATWRRIIALREIDGRVHGLRLSRNFGHQYALLAGLTHATGFLRRELRETLTLRAIPELAFHLDHSLQNRMRVEELLDSLKHDQSATGDDPE